MTPEEYFTNDLPYNATCSPASISSLIGTAKTITAQDTNGKIGGKDSNIQCASNNTLCSIDAGGSSKNFDYDEQGWFRLNKTLQQPVNFSIELDDLIVKGSITGPSGIINIKFLIKRTDFGKVVGSQEYASVQVDNSKNIGIDNKTGATISAIIDNIVTKGPIKDISAAPQRAGARPHAAGNVVSGWNLIENFRIFFRSAGITQPADLNKIAISENCILTINTDLFKQPRRLLARLVDKHIAVAPLLLKFYGDQTFRITASYASKLNQIYQAKTPIGLNNIFSNNPANALSVNIASSDYIHFISTLCHDVKFDTLQILEQQQHTDVDVPFDQMRTSTIYNELPLLLGENIPGPVRDEDSMAKPNITVILAQDDIQKSVLSAFCGRGFTENQPHVGEFMSCLAKSIIKNVKNNPILQAAVKDVFRKNQKFEIIATRARPMKLKQGPLDLE